MTVFYSNGRVEKDVNLERRATKLVVKADSGPKCGPEWPHMVVEVDKPPGALDHDPGERLHVCSGQRARRHHTVAVSYDNDYYEPVDAFTSDSAQAAHL